MNALKAQFNGPAKQTGTHFLKAAGTSALKGYCHICKMKTEYQYEVTMWAGLALQEDREGKPQCLRDDQSLRYWLSNLTAFHFCHSIS